MLYKVIIADRLELSKAIETLEKYLRPYLDTGWKLQGGVSITAIGDTNYHYYSAAQAIVK